MFNFRFWFGCVVGFCLHKLTRFSFSNSSENPVRGVFQGGVFVPFDSEEKK